MLPIPSFYDESKADSVYRVDYYGLQNTAKEYTKQNKVKPASSDKFRIAALGIDTQNTFCIPGFELFVGGRSKRGSIDDNIRVTKWIYTNLDSLTTLANSLDTHRQWQIFHPAYWVDADGNHPVPGTTEAVITHADVVSGRWSVNPAMSVICGKNIAYLQNHALHYTKKLEEGGKYPLIVWPYHAMFGGIGHALVSIIEEATVFHGFARETQSVHCIKGGHQLTENYSVFAPEVTTDHTGATIAQQSIDPVKLVTTHDRVYVYGQAKSHCVLSSIRDMKERLSAVDKDLVKRVWLLRDGSSPVVVFDPNGNIVPGLDFTDVADKAYLEFERDGMHVVNTTDQITF